MANDDSAAALLALERAAMDRWGQGDPGGFLDLCAPDVTYFDPFQHARLDGRDALARLYESLRGQVRIDRCEFIGPQVQTAGDLAVLSYNFESWTGESRSYWHATEVYRREPQGWRIVHTHWSIPREG